MSRKHVLAVLSVCVLAVLAGCATTGTKQGSATTTQANLRVAKALQFPDVPVPSDFKFEPELSFSAQGVGYRLGEFVYSGEAEGYDIIRFFREQLLANGWEEVRNIDIGARAMLYFRKGEERCTVIIQRGTTLKSTQIRIWLL